jgi:hypothetical protein
MSNITDFEYYENSGVNPKDENWGNYQYVLLKDIINNFYMMYVGDDKVINDCKRYEVVFHAKRGLQELNYDVAKEVKALELDLPDNLQLPVPKDYINYVRISWVDEDGKFRPIIQNNQSGIVRSYLQDNKNNILFDNNGEALQGTSVTEINSRNPKSTNMNDSGTEYLYGSRFGIDGKTANQNGTFIINKNLGVMRFSSDLVGKTIVVEYVSDGMSDLYEDEIKVNKLAEKFLYHFIKYEILTNKFGVQEYIVQRARNEYRAIRNNTKIRMANIRYDEILQSMRGASNWTK